MITTTREFQRDLVNSLGIPVDNVTLKQAEDQIIAMAKKRDGKARLVSTLNVDFLVNSLGFGGCRARHPELLNILRKSDLVTADGFPVLWLSRIVGKPLHQRVTGSDLMPTLAGRAAREGLSLYLFGGAKNAAEKAADVLRRDNPELRIAGTSSPFIHTSGAGITDWETADRIEVEQINRSGADILFVGLGNPKQELWFNRNRHRLTVPVAIGVGGTFEFITGGVRRAPAWLQRLNLEWVFRITQDPVRLWRRYANGLIKLALITSPLLYYRAIEIASRSSLKKAAQAEPEWKCIWSSREDSFQVIHLPKLVSRRYLETLISQLYAAHDGSASAVWLDFSSVRHIELAGHQELFSLARLVEQRENTISLLAIPAAVSRQLRACRVLDALGTIERGNTFNNLTRHRAGNRTSASCRSYLVGNLSLIQLAGHVDSNGLKKLGFIECLSHTARDRICVIDLRNVTLLESSAIGDLLTTLTVGAASGNIKFSGVNAAIKQMIKVADIDLAKFLVSDTTLLHYLKTGGKSYE